MATKSCQLLSLPSVMIKNLLKLSEQTNIYNKLTQTCKFIGNHRLIQNGEKIVKHPS